MYEIFHNLCKTRDILQFSNFFYLLIDIDVRTNKPKAKLYKDEEGNFKGDGLCTYVKVESVQLGKYNNLTP